MNVQTTIAPMQVQVRNEYEVVVLRQQVREIARMLGMSLVAQAKLSAAISALARGLLQHKQSAVFMIQSTGAGVLAALEVTCVTSLCECADVPELIQSLGVADLRTILDEAHESQSADCVTLTMRMRLARPA